MCKLIFFVSFRHPVSASKSVPIVRVLAGPGSVWEGRQLFLHLLVGRLHASVPFVLASLSLRRGRLLKAVPNVERRNRGADDGNKNLSPRSMKYGPWEHTNTHKTSFTHSAYTV